ncbi:NlpC/P60 family protein [Alkalihalobacillus sp. BA299]|uniref:C40 family peptidase n=1 Tax=Alkalihalobacillus sp. BA299 TaxID=2815938 RepID=UPI001ADA3A61|nr:NlpC/P60 family protein [Alkalihalobacillus sp. BA299]
MKRKLTHVVIATALAATLLHAVPATTYANPPTNYSAQIEELETKILTYDNKIIEAIAKVEDLTKEIEQGQQQIEQNQKDLEEAQQKFDSLKEIYFERLRAIQQNGQSPMLTYIDVILTSNGLGDLIERVTLISQVIEQDQKLLENIQNAELELTTLQEELVKEVEHLESNKQTVKNEQAAMKKDKDIVMKELDRFKELQRQEEIRLAEEERQATLAEEEQQPQQTELENGPSQTSQNQSSVNNSNTKTPAPTSSNSNKNTSTNSNPAPSVSSGNQDQVTQLINYSKQFLGTPYVWGGTTPSGFDCSGFTSYVFRSIGVNLPRVSRQQAQVGVAVPLNQVQPGDLIFRGNPIHHVGIYIGNGQYIHSPQTGDVVKISSYNPSKHTQARRVLN